MIRKSSFFTYLFKYGIYLSIIYWLKSIILTFQEPDFDYMLLVVPIIFIPIYLFVTNKLFHLYLDVDKKIILINYFKKEMIDPLNIETINKILWFNPPLIRVKMDNNNYFFGKTFYFLSPFRLFGFGIPDEMHEIEDLRDKAVFKHIKQNNQTN